MSSTLEALEAEALQLSASERARLVDRLIASLDIDPEVEEAWAAEVERRNAEIESGVVSLIPGPQALANSRLSSLEILAPSRGAARSPGGS